MRNRLAFIAMLLGSAAVFSAQSAMAQAIDVDEQALARSGDFLHNRNVSVQARQQPEYMEPPMHVGALDLTPKLIGSVEYNDNIYATKSSQVSDTIGHLGYDVTLASDWNQNRVALFSRLDSALYSDRSSENYTDWVVGANGRLDVTRDGGVAGGLSYGGNHESRFAPNSPIGSVNPVEFNTLSGFATGARSFNRLRISASVRVDDRTFDDANNNVGAVIVEHDRDVTELQPKLRAEFAMGPTLSVFSEVTGDDRSFRDQQPGEIARNSSGYRGLLGASFDLSHLSTGSVALGYLKQDYDSNAYKSYDGFLYDFNLEYYPTGLTTLSLTGRRSIIDSNITGVGSYTQSPLTLRIDHELKRNIKLNAAVHTETDKFNGVDRTDTITGVTLGASVMLNRRIWLNFNAESFDQTSSGVAAGPEFTINRALLTLTYSL